MEFFENRYFLGQNKQLSKLKKKELTNLEVSRDKGEYAPVSSSQRSQSDACRLKTVGFDAFECRKFSLFRRAWRVVVR